MASSNISSFNSRIQFSVDQAPKNAGNSIIGAAIDRHNAETQGTLYSHKGTGKIANIIDSQNAVKSDTKQTAPPSITNIDMIPKDQFGHIKKAHLKLILKSAVSFLFANSVIDSI